MLRFSRDIVVSNDDVDDVVLISPAKSDFGQGSRQMSLLFLQLLFQTSCWTPAGFLWPPVGEQEQSCSTSWWGMMFSPYCPLGGAVLKYTGGPDNFSFFWLLVLNKKKTPRTTTKVPWIYLFSFMNSGLRDRIYTEVKIKTFQMVVVSRLWNKRKP